MVRPMTFLGARGGAVANTIAVKSVLHTDFFDGNVPRIINIQGLNGSSLKVYVARDEQDSNDGIISSDIDWLWLWYYPRFIRGLGRTYSGAWINFESDFSVGGQVEVTAINNSNTMAVYIQEFSE